MHTFRALALTLCFAAISASIGAAQTLACDQEDSLRRMQVAIDLSIITGARVIGNTPTILIERSDWEILPSTTRLRLLGTFDCAMAGPGGRLRRIDIADPTGDVIATWNGTTLRLTSR